MLLLLLLLFVHAEKNRQSQHLRATLFVLLHYTVQWLFETILTNTHGGKNALLKLWHCEVLPATYLRGDLAVEPQNLREFLVVAKLLRFRNKKKRQGKAPRNKLKSVDQTHFFSNQAGAGGY